MAAPKITLYVDVVSPFAYLAYYITRHSPVFAKCEVSYIPVFLGGIIKATGNSAPIAVKSMYSPAQHNKAKWIHVERLRWARYFNVPMTLKPAKGFPVQTLALQRALCAMASKDPGKLVSCLDALYHSHWVEANPEIGKPEGFMPILEQVVGKEAAEGVTEKSVTEAVKSMLAANTEKAIDAGAFGLPWMVCTNSKGETESFFGVDHFGQVAAFLGLETLPDKGFRYTL
ncbi:conserved hypothetical protein [Uncinocarpus reesii 1704]|uniref:Glutathione S-transferase kappa n=1 Tax=Uncinocarpus reesii (strain UAMH 1704) TaxID=336963 RepID=C4JHS8_UNCRE|nr:uncharacterized protein UREG_02764 [Uncinocarpus reesii 1704]EEP77915.1 conserved hypothetical protein [Uncinocarpus reesii 1704]